MNVRVCLSRLLFLGFLTLASPSALLAASVPDGADIRIGEFAFPQAAYTGAEEEAARLSLEFREQVASALRQAGLKAVVSSERQDERETKNAPETLPVTGSAKTGRKTSSNKDVADGEDEFSIGEDGDEEDVVTDNAFAGEEGLTGAQKAAEEPEDEPQSQTGAEKAGKKVSGKSGVYIISGAVTRYEEQAGAPVKIGAVGRLHAGVVLECAYKVNNPAGNVIVSENVSASFSRIVVNTADIYVVLQGLAQKVFFEASHNIAERVSGKKRVKNTEDREDAAPGSEDDEYADSPGKRLKSTSGSKPVRMKWTIN